MPAALEGQARQIAGAVERFHALRACLAQGQAPAAGDLARLLGAASGFSVAFDLPWPWGGELRLADGHVFACHGSPASGDLNYLLEDVSPGRPVLAPEDAIRPHLQGSDPATPILCGHTHVPRVVQIGPVLAVNPGSVGMPAYTDDGAIPHAIGTGAPHDRYAVVTRGPGGTWSAELRAVAHDWNRTARQAAANGPPAVACWTATGRA